MASFLDATADSDSDSDSSSDDTHLDSMMQQDARATRLRMQDVGYREGKDELVDANVNAQASFERGVASGFAMSERAGRVRGMMVALVAILDTKIRQSKSTTDANGGHLHTSLVERMKLLVEQIQLLSNPTLISNELMATCETLLLEQGFAVK